MKKGRTSTLLGAGLFGVSLLIAPLAFATAGTSEESSTAVTGQQPRQQTGGKQHRTKGKRAKKTSVKPEETSAL
jgi:hypothetical protein